jgi:hypothetical protein
MQSAWTSEQLLQGGDPALPHESDGGLKAKVSMIWGVDDGGEGAFADEDVDAAAAADAEQLLHGGKVKRKESLIDRISRRFQTIERGAGSSVSGRGAETMQPQPHGGAESFWTQQKQVDMTTMLVSHLR